MGTENLAISDSTMMRVAILCVIVAYAAAVPVTTQVSVNTEASLADATLYTLEKVASTGDCGQLSIPSADVKPAQAVDKNLKVGTCASAGYAVADGQETKKVPVLGSLTILKFKKASAFAAAQDALAEARLKQPQTGYFSFTFTGDGCPGAGGGCPKSGCYQEDLNCEYCLAAWRAYPPDSSYKYNAIVSHGCAGKKVDCPECQGMMGLSRYDK